ncbi:MAG: hypothetical protein KBS46_00300 [Clostridiales bacterium]|nr:hypothetical protein [Candidatus Apopatocola equi]
MRAYLYDPTGNMTVLVEGEVSAEERRTVADGLMARCPEAEQLGFLSGGREGCDIRLDMAGGEFCGNAAMCAAAHFARTHGGGDRLVTVSVSGEEKPLQVRLEQRADGFAGRVHMPLPLSVEEVRLGEHTLPLVRFAGISHLISDGILARQEAEENIRRWCAQLGADCLGVMLYDRLRGQLAPLVYVANIDTLFWENSCASGSAAVGVWLYAREGKSVSASFSEPGGVLAAECDGENLILRGSVRLKYEIE